MAILRSNMLCSTILDVQSESNRGKKGFLKALKDSFSEEFPAIATHKLAKLSATNGTEEDSIGGDGGYDHSLATNGTSHIKTPPTSKPSCSADHPAHEEVSNKDCALSCPPGDILSTSNI